MIVDLCKAMLKQDLKERPYVSEVIDLCEKALDHLTTAGAGGGEGKQQQLAVVPKNRI